MYRNHMLGETHGMALEPMTGCGLMGALKCVAGMKGVLPMIHGPVSCSSGHRMAMLFAEVEPLLPTTCVEQTQVVLGCIDRLADAMNKAFEIYHPEVLLVLLTCATAMTGEDYQKITFAYCEKTGKHVLVMDGSALAGDEVDICPRVYRAFEEILHLSEGTSKSIALEGFARTDYAFTQNISALETLIFDSMCAKPVRGLFSGGDFLTPYSEYRTAHKVTASLLWDRADMMSTAPIGVRGSRRFLQYLSRETGLPLRPEADSIRDAYEEKLAPIAQTLKKQQLRIAIEGAGWYGYALADFLKNDLGCRVLLSVDCASDAIAWHQVCDEFYEDTGRFELVELMEAFGAKVVFGSSNVQMNESWTYLPFFQPVWRVVDPIATLGYTAAIALAQRLLKEANT